MINKEPILFWYQVYSAILSLFGYPSTLFSPQCFSAIAREICVICNNRPNNNKETVVFGVTHLPKKKPFFSLALKEKSSSIPCTKKTTIDLGYTINTGIENAGLGCCVSKKSKLLLFILSDAGDLTAVSIFEGEKSA